MTESGRSYHASEMYLFLFARVCVPVAGSALRFPSSVIIAVAVGVWPSVGDFEDIVRIFLVPPGCVSRRQAG